MSDNIHISHEKHPTKGILICLLGYFFVSLIGLAEKSISHAIHIGTILFFQNLICLILILFKFSHSKDKELKIQQFNTYAIRILTGVGCYAVLFYIIRFIPISEALIYQYSASLWIPFIMLFWLNIKMPRKMWYGILVGFAGILLILNPNSSILGTITFWGFFCGILQALSVVAIRKLSTTESNLRIMFYTFLVGTLITLPLYISDYSRISLHDFIFLLAVGISSYLSQKFIVLSLNYANPSTLGPVCYSTILFSGLTAWFFWHEVPSKENLFGMGLVLLGCILTVVMSTSVRSEVVAYKEFEN